MLAVPTHERSSLSHLPEHASRGRGERAHGLQGSPGAAAAERPVAETIENRPFSQCLFACVNRVSWDALCMLLTGKGPFATVVSIIIDGEGLGGVLTCQTSFHHG